MKKCFLVLIVLVTSSSYSALVTPNMRLIAWVNQGFTDICSVPNPELFADHNSQVWNNRIRTALGYEEDHGCPIEEGEFRYPDMITTDNVFHHLRNGIYADESEAAIQRAYIEARGYSCKNWGKIDRCEMSFDPEYEIPSDLLFPSIYSDGRYWVNTEFCVNHNKQLYFCDFIQDGDCLKVIGVVLCKNKMDSFSVKKKMIALLAQYNRQQAKKNLGCCVDKYPKHTPKVKLWFVEDKPTAQQVMTFLSLLLSIVPDAESKKNVEPHKVLLEETPSFLASSSMKHIVPKHQQRPQKVCKNNRVYQQQNYCSRRGSNKK